LVVLANVIDYIDGNFWQVCELENLARSVSWKNLPIGSELENLTTAASWKRVVILKSPKTLALEIFTM
jgi:hypothetical protein